MGEGRPRVRHHLYSINGNSGNNMTLVFTYLSDWNSLNGSELKLKSVAPRSGLGNLRGADC